MPSRGHVFAVLSAVFGAAFAVGAAADSIIDSGGWTHNEYWETLRIGSRDFR